MENNSLNSIKPTKDELGFYVGIEELPHGEDRWHAANPLNDLAVIQFDIPQRGHCVYYLPKTRTTLLRHSQFDVEYLRKEMEMSDLIRKFTFEQPKDTGKVVEEFTRSFVYPVIIGSRLVYRFFERSFCCRQVNSEEYECEADPAKEIRRYVFCEEGAFVEYPDGAIKAADPEELRDVSDTDNGQYTSRCNNTYDLFIEADDRQKTELYHSFLNEVEIPYKRQIAEAMWKLDDFKPKLGFGRFTHLFAYATGDPGRFEDVPERVLDVLHNRKHPKVAAVKLYKDLVVITDERETDFFGLKEEVRLYADGNNAYCFRKNAITGEWIRDNPVMCVKLRYGYKERIVDRDIFEHTCLEQFAYNSIAEYIYSRGKVKVATITVLKGFLAAEQAAKSYSPLYYQIFNDIFSGRIIDGSRSFPELLGLKGGQLKFLKNIDIGNDISLFARMINSPDFVLHFPDIKKRIFAVSFYLDGYDERSDSFELDKEEIFPAAHTLNSLERNDHEKRERRMDLYRDYLKMYRKYAKCIEKVSDRELAAEMTAFGIMPLNLKPSRIEDYHAKMCRILDILDCSENFRKYSEKIAELKKSEARKVEYSKGNYSIIMPKDALDIITEGRVLQHCVGRAGYIELMASGRCHILFIREKAHPGKPLITMEVRFDDIMDTFGKKRSGTIRQVYGFRDSYNHDPKIRDLIKKYASKMGYEITAVIYSENDNLI
ncbi:MAG: PcfJ domain-containing protein [Lachnospiraceae bacterium]|nr:PcfJ domain-containing protein [Lachnospiraceae bacterium]